MTVNITAQERNGSLLAWGVRCTSTQVPLKTIHFASQVGSVAKSYCDDVNVQSLNTLMQFVQHSLSG